MINADRETDHWWSSRVDKGALEHPKNTFRPKIWKRNESQQYLRLRKRRIDVQKLKPCVWNYKKNELKKFLFAHPLSLFARFFTWYFPVFAKKSDYLLWRRGNEKTTDALKATQELKKVIDTWKKMLEPMYNITWKVLRWDSTYFFHVLLNTLFLMSKYPLFLVRLFKSIRFY